MRNQQLRKASLQEMEMLPSAANVVGAADEVVENAVAIAAAIADIVPATGVARRVVPLKLLIFRSSPTS